MKHPRPAAIAILSAAALGMGGCDWFQGPSSSAETKMENVEILPGTASDEMITLDSASGDGTAIDPSVDVAAPATVDDREGGPSDREDDAAPDTPASSEDAGATQAGDVVIRPPAERDEPETK